MRGESPTATRRSQPSSPASPEMTSAPGRVTGSMRLWPSRPWLSKMLTVTDDGGLASAESMWTTIEVLAGAQPTRNRQSRTNRIGARSVYAEDSCHRGNARCSRFAAASDRQPGPGPPGGGAGTRVDDFIVPGHTVEP